MSQSTVSNVFSAEEIEYLMNLPEVTVARAKVINSGSVHFRISLNDALRSTILSRLGLDLSSHSELPMRWMKGDTPSHADTGRSSFERTYIVYLTDSAGEFVVGQTEYTITANTAFIFNEGLVHKTENTGSTPRLLLGPMNEFAEPVGGSLYIVYYNNYTDALLQNENHIATQGVSYILNDTLYYGSIGSYSSWRVAAVDGSATVPVGVYSNGFDLSTLGYTDPTFYVYPAAPCFLEGTTILCQRDGVDVYLPIETIPCGTLVKTSRDGYKKVECIGKSQLQNPGNSERIEQRLYKCSPKAYPELREDLYLTGCHSILVGSLSDVEREKTTKQLGKIFVTDKKYRLIACIDERAEPWNSEGTYTIWHVALENADPKMNYGIYANGGLLVESCSIRFLKNKSNMVQEC